MLSKTETVWRHLLVGALEHGRRREPSLTAIARELGFGISTVHKALERPVDIGAVIVHPSRGVRTVNPWKLLILWAGKRDVERDVIRRSATALSAADAERAVAASGAVMGGFGGLVGYMGDNSIAAYDTVMYYGEPLPGIEAEDGPTSLVVLQPDPLLHRYGAVAPLAQCWVDLFNTPGWQAARFVEETPGRLIGATAA